ncbi:MAG TPA: hypothetical protein VFC33_03830 [Acidimicrobiia bacterium]|nr:hypothetical protein [Acidimicrobiia bacterium]
MSRISDHCGGGDAGRPLVAGTLRGYRTWRPLTRWAHIPDGALPLAAVTQRHVVWGTTLSARCTLPAGVPEPPIGFDHPAPSAGCTCGIYAWYEPDDTGILTARVFGVIQASGVVLMGDRGFRAQHAEIVAIVTRNRRLALACEEAGIRVYRRRSELLDDFPPEDVSGLIGDTDDDRAGADPGTEHADGDAPRTGDGDVEIEVSGAGGHTDSEAHDQSAAPRGRTVLENRMLVASICARSAIIAAAAVLLPGIAALLAILCVESLLIGYLVARVR